MFNGTLYQYTCLPNGFSSALRVFTKLLKPVYASLHTLGHLSLGYIDDSYLQGDNAKECSSNIKATALLFNRLGFHLHPAKSVIIPTQALTSLGFRLDSLSMTVSPTREKNYQNCGSLPKARKYDQASNLRGCRSYWPLSVLLPRCPIWAFTLPLPGEGQNPCLDNT